MFPFRASKIMKEIDFHDSEELAEITDKLIGRILEGVNQYRVASCFIAKFEIKVRQDTYYKLLICIVNIFIHKKSKVV